MSDDTAWTDNSDMLLFYEAIVKVRENTLKPETTRQMVRKAIKAYMRQQNLFSDYLTPDEYKAYKSSQTSKYAGVGMDIFQDRSGKFVCVPFPGGPADKGGLKYGDVLTFVEGRAANGLSVFNLGPLIRGRPGTSVGLTIQTPKGNIKQVSLIRKQIKFQTVLIDQTGKVPVLKILSFTSKTARELKEALKELQPGVAKVIDLRGNTGGDLFASIDAAALFLKSGKKIVDFKTRKGIKPYLAGDGPLDTVSRLIIWQDGLTASAAEVFLAALVENGRAVSIGRTSFGKGVAQGVVELTDGSALFVTNGALHSPKDGYYHDHGLDPTHEIKAELWLSDKEYAAMTAKIIRKSR